MEHVIPLMISKLEWLAFPKGGTGAQKSLGDSTNIQYRGESNHACRGVITHETCFVGLPTLSPRI